MSVWDSYHSRVKNSDGIGRDRILENEKRAIRRKITRSLSYHHHAVINGEDRNLAIINSDNLHIKTLCSLPGEDLPHGGLVNWMNNYWLITERDANNEVYTRAIMQQCNYLLRWVSDDGRIMERWCIVEDGTKYLTGEYGDNDFVLTRGDSRVQLTIAKDEYTINFGRDQRFLIDAYESDSVLAYRLTKPFKLGGSFDETGVLRFVLTECNTEDDDNIELHIADYYKHFPSDRAVDKPAESEKEESAERKAWF